MNIRMNTLIQKLINNTATKQELDELKEMMDNGHAERILDEQFQTPPHAEAERLTEQERTYMLENILDDSRKMDTLIQKFVNNTATQEELAELEKMMDNVQVERILDEQFSLPRAEADGLTDRERKNVIGNILGKSGRKGPSRGFGFFLAIAASVILMIAAVIYMVKFNASPIPASQELTTVTHSDKGYHKLPDGSMVYLNERSEISYNKSFGITDREVNFKGEALFDVVHDPSKPFKVKAGDVTTTVLGTKFNVKVTSNQVAVTVERGKVRVDGKDKPFGTITPNEQITVNTITKDFKKSEVNAKEFTAWTEGDFILEDMNFAEAATKIEKRFNVTVIIRNESLKNCPVSVGFTNGESLSEIIEYISLGQQAKATREGRSVIIEGGVGCDNDK